MKYSKYFEHCPDLLEKFKVLNEMRENVEFEELLTLKDVEEICAIMFEEGQDYVPPQQPDYISYKKV